MNPPDWLPGAMAIVFTIIFIVVMVLARGDSEVDHWLEYDERKRQEEKDELRRLQIEYYKRENARWELDA